MSPSLLSAVVLLALWVVLGFVIPVGVGAVHLLLAAACVLLVRWWALREP
ncbi:MAG TPA: hypothetical protein VNK43_00305 [Gemmatimonadales bacterium]|nr:hypothetical protein [Gemmatimonadales bacterium]